jgi:hypothetical protein
MWAAYLAWWRKNPRKPKKFFIHLIFKITYSYKNFEHLKRRY